jgi:hypothetical protein
LNVAIATNGPVNGWTDNVRRDGTAVEQLESGNWIISFRKASKKEVERYGKERR